MVRIGSILGRGSRSRGKSWLDTVSIEELEKERMRIDNHIQVLSREIQRLEERKKELFRQGVGKSEVEKMLLAEKIKDVDMEIKMKIREYNRLMKQRRALSNLIMLKNWEGRLKETGIWERIRSLDQEQLIQALSNVEFESEMFERNIDRINEVLGARQAEVTVDRETREIMELWEKVEKAELSPETVEDKLRVKISTSEAGRDEEAEKETL